MKAISLLIGLVLGCGSVTGDPESGADAGSGPASAALAGLEVSAGTLVPPFDPAVTDYTLTLPLNAADLVVTATAETPATARIEVAGGAVESGDPAPAVSLALGDSFVDVVVTPDSGEPRTYTIAASRGPGIAQRAHLKASNAGAGDGFGVRTALSGDTLAVCAAFEASAGDPADDSAPGAGAVYVFVRDGDAWRQQAYLKASNAGADDECSDLALDGDSLVMGAEREDGAGDALTDSGAAYVFVRDGETWSRQAILRASNAGAGDELGQAVAISGDTVAVSARREDGPSDSVTGSGAVYVFARVGGIWSEQAVLRAAVFDAGDQLGTSVALDGDTLVAGAPLEDSAGDPDDDSALTAGAAYVFVRAGGSWTQQAYLKSPTAAAGDRFGDSVALSGDTLAVGASSDDSRGADAGGAFVFTRSGGAWSQGTFVAGAETSAGDRFGKGLDLDGDLLAVGARFEADEAGAAYLFARVGDDWIQLRRLQGSNTKTGDRFDAVSVDGDVVAIGAYREDSLATDSGAVYVFE